MIEFACPVCKTPHKATPRSAGKKVPCRCCGQRLQIPEPRMMRTVLGQPLSPGPSPIVPQPIAKGPAVDSGPDLEARGSYLQGLALLIFAVLAGVSGSGPRRLLRLEDHRQSPERSGGREDANDECDATTDAEHAAEAGRTDLQGDRRLVVAFGCENRVSEWSRFWFHCPSGPHRDQFTRCRRVVV